MRSTLKLRFLLPAVAFGLFAAHAASAQAPAGAPAGSNGVCNDGTYSTAATKSGACRGHKGVKTWFGPAAPAKPTTTATATPPPAPKPAPAPAPAPKPAPTPAPAPKPTTATAAAPGGGPGMVWVNTASKVYHCPTDRYYGKTKAGNYMTEAAALAAGDKPDAGKKCF